LPIRYIRRAFQRLQEQKAAALVRGMSEAPPGGPGRISASQWRQIVDSATDTAIISLDPTGRVTSWNEGARRILGWHEQEMLGCSLDRLFTEDDLARNQLAREIAEARRIGRGGGEEGWRLRKDGTRFWATGEVAPVVEAGEIIGFVKILRDRTLQRRAEETIRKERQAFEILNRASAALAVENDLHRVVQIVTDAGVELTGAAFGAFFYNVLDDTGESYMLYTLSGAPAEAFSKFPMPRNTAVFAPTFNGEGIVRSDDITQDPRYGHNAPRRGMPEGHLPVRSYLAVPVTSRSEGVVGGLFFGHADVGVFDEQSERGLAGLAAEAAVAIDNARLSKAAHNEIADRVRAEEALRELNATLEQQVAERTEQLRKNEQALRQSQKMEAVGQLTGGVAHDFNNLLQIIVGNLEVLRRTLPPNSGRQHRAVEQAMTGAKRAAALTQRLLAFARRQPLDPKPIDVNSLMSGMSDLLHRSLGETISVETVSGAGLWPVEADRHELEAAILNLAVNARDAMPNGGRLTVETTNVRIDENYAAAHAEVTPGQYVAIAVSDTGEGMDAGTAAQAFEPFFTTKPVGKGTGLGLSQVYGFVKQSGGHVKLYSELGQGTTVRIYLPRLTRVGAPIEVETDPTAPEGSTEETILVLEDDDDVRTYSVESLRELGYRVIEAHDGPSALRLLERQPHVDLLFTDVVLPGGLTGAQVAAQAHALRPTLKVLFTTGYARNAIIHHGRLDKGVSLLTKPFTYADLAAKVRDILDQLPPDTVPK
jgi:PAS domain S-box-containing protein